MTSVIGLRLAFFSPYKRTDLFEIHNFLEDKSGTRMGYSIYTFSFIYNTGALKDWTPSTTPTVLANTQHAGKIASHYRKTTPCCSCILATSRNLAGTGSQLTQLNVIFNHGTNVARNLVTAREKAIVVGSSFRSNSVTNGTDNLTWDQRMGIMAKAKRPAAAMLFMTWII